MGTLFSPGKLLLTSEYFVLDGALALAVPTKLGQDFFFQEIEDQRSLVTWEAYHEGELWLKAIFNYKSWIILQTNHSEPALFILKVLQNVQKLSTTKFKKNSSYFLKTDLQFPANFGLGSSSTLMNNLADWASIDAFKLNENSLGGSGYDIAIAKEKSAILYQNAPERKVKPISFSPSFSNQLIFIHLNQKQNSREGITLYKSKEKSEELIHFFSNITENVISCDNLVNFSELMELHEAKLSNFLKIPTVKEKYFKNCPVFVKSLGAWGGDFVMSSAFDGHQDYFLGKGFPTIFSWEDIIQ